MNPVFTFADGTEVYAGTLEEIQSPFFPMAAPPPDIAPIYLLVERKKPIVVASTDSTFGLGMDADQAIALAEALVLAGYEIKRIKALEARKKP